MPVTLHASGTVVIARTSALLADCPVTRAESCVIVLSDVVTGETCAAGVAVVTMTGSAVVTSVTLAVRRQWLLSQIRCSIVIVSELVWVICQIPHDWNPLTAFCTLAHRLYAPAKIAATSDIVIRRPGLLVIQFPDSTLYALFSDLKNDTSSGCSR